MAQKLVDERKTMKKAALSLMAVFVVQVISASLISASTYKLHVKIRGVLDNHSFRAIDYGKNGVPSLSRAQLRVMRSVLVATPVTMRRTLTFTLSRKRFLLFYNTSQQVDDHTEGYHLIGSRIECYGKYGVDTPFGVFTVPTEYHQTIDAVARAAYRANHVAGPTLQ